MTVSFFPLGSYVLLNDGHVGRGPQATGDQYATPAEEAWMPERFGDEPDIVNLSQSGQFNIAKPLARLPSE